MRYVYVPFGSKRMRVPIVRDVHTRTLRRIESGSGRLQMLHYHGFNGNACGTTHCRAGWAVHLGGEIGRRLERKVGTRAAANMIFEQSTLAVGLTLDEIFNASDSEAMADIRRCADAEASLHASEKAARS